MNASIGKSLEMLSRRIRPYFSPKYRETFNRMVARGLKEHQGEPFVVCDFSNPAIDSVGGRYYAGIILDFIAAGFFPVFTAKRVTLSNFGTGKKLLLLGKRMGVVQSLDEMCHPYFLFTDRTAPPPALATRVITVDYQYRLAGEAGEIELPFFVHPKIGANIHLPKVYRIEERRQARIFFGGSTRGKSYNKDVISEKYHILTRHQMLVAATGAADHDVYKPREAAEWLSSGKYHPFVMFESQNTKIPWDRWLDALAKTDFFLACPGVGMPLCHNLIEAMAAGAIPILQYGKYLPQPLEAGINSLSFDTESDLCKIVQRVLAMRQEEIRCLRLGVRNYYDKHLAPGRFTKSLFTGDRARATLLMNAYRVPRK